MKPESSDPKDPETNTWWVWIPIVIALWIIFMSFIFGRDHYFESKVVIDAIGRLA